MEKKGLAPSAIEEKMKNIPKDEIQGILEDLKNSLSPEERKAFEKRGSFIPKKQIVQNVPPQELRNKWFFGVLLLYLLLLMFFTVPVILFSFPQEATQPFIIFKQYPYYIFLIIMFQAKLFFCWFLYESSAVVPFIVVIFFFPILLTGSLTGALLLAMACTLMEFLFELNRNSIIVPFMFFSSTAIALLIWIGWTILFYQMSRRDKPETIILKQCRLLLKGSILELLIAVPTHIIVRSRDYCCAGMMTFLGIAVGVPVMLFSFGPSIYFLFVDRWHSLRPATFNFSKDKK
jgi:hypothetical protein